jgi:hypothetical protein
MFAYTYVGGRNGDDKVSPMLMRRAQLHLAMSATSRDSTFMQATDVKEIPKILHRQIMKRVLQ